MANICEFNMALRGRKENIEEFLLNMQQKKEPYMGRGAWVSSNIEWQEPDDNGNTFVCFFGDCKWSVHSSMIDNAISMRTTPNKWSFSKGVRAEDLSFVTLDENCKRLHLSMEVYSKEPGCAFQEHIRYVADTEEYSDDCCEYFEYFFDDFDTKEEAEEEYGITLTDTEFNNGYLESGGYDSWDFEI